MLKEWEAEDQFEELLNESCPPVDLLGCLYDYGRLLRQADELAFREAMLNHYDAMGVELT